MTASRCLTIALLTAGLAAGTVLGGQKEELKERFEARHARVVALKDAGKIGETATGYLEAVSDAHAGDKTVRSVVKAENTDRKALYKLLAAEQKTTVEEVGRQNAIFKFKKADDDEFFKGKDGVWRRKSAMLKR